MKIIILFTVCFLSFNTYAQNRANNRQFNNRQQGFTIQTPSGPMRYTSPFQYERDSLEGTGFTFTGYAKVKDGVISVWNRDCKDVVIGDLNTEQDESVKSRLRNIKAGQKIRFKMAGSRTCKVFSWE